MKNITAIAETIMHTLKDNRLIPMIKILADLRRDFLAHEPGTEAQASSYKLYKTYLDRHLAGEMYVPKF
jgi:hypothetical protein